MTDLQLTLTDEETRYLVELLENALKETRIEEHRTRTPSYREHLLVGLLNKLAPNAVT
jgi:hypothetical protein